MVKLTGLSVRDIRFPTSLELHGSDAMVRTLQKPLKQIVSEFLSNPRRRILHAHEVDLQPFELLSVPPPPRPYLTAFPMARPGPAKGGISEEGDREIKTEVIA